MSTSPVSRLDAFRPTAERGAPRIVEAAWYLVKVLFFLTAIPWPSRMKVALLKTFGARVGEGVVIAPMVNIHMPWKLTIGDNCWIGQEVFLLTLEPVDIGSHVCLSQRVFVCTGNHDYRSESFAYFGKPINLRDGSWVGADAFIGPGVDIGANTVVQAGSVVLESLPEGQVCGGNPAKPLRPRV